jgi:hypothetical protein
MTTPLICDAGNVLLSTQPCKLIGSVADTAEGSRLMLTIRTPSTTLTVFLTRAEAREWGQNILAMGAQVNGLAAAPGLARKGRRRG